MARFDIRLPNRAHLQVRASLNMVIPRMLCSEGIANYERDSLAATLTVLSRHPGMFVDVGANIGVFSLLAAAVLRRETLAFEPLPGAAETLQVAATDNRLPITVDRRALSDSDGTADFYVSAITDSSSGLNRRFRKAKSSFPVTLARLDDVLAGRAPSLIKIDTETTEPAVLAGAAGTLDKHRPWLIIEVLPERTETAIEAFFAGRGYHAYRIDGAAVWPVRSKVVGDSTYTYNNWLFAPVPLDDTFFTELARWRAELAVSKSTVKKAWLPLRLARQLVALARR